MLQRTTDRLATALNWLWKQTTTRDEDIKEGSHEAHFFRKGIGPTFQQPTESRVKRHIPYVLLPMFLSACDSRAPEQLGTTTSAVTLTAATSQVVPSDPPAAAPAGLQAPPAVLATGSALETADSPRMPAWSPARPKTVCSPAPTSNIVCPATSPTPSLCNSVADLPAGCVAFTTPGASYSPNGVPACCR